MKQFEFVVEEKDTIESIEVKIRDFNLAVLSVGPNVLFTISISHGEHVSEWTDEIEAHYEQIAKAIVAKQTRIWAIEIKNALRTLYTAASKHESIRKLFSLPIQKLIISPLPESLNGSVGSQVKFLEMCANIQWHEKEKLYSPSFHCFDLSQWFSVPWDQDMLEKEPRRLFTALSLQSTLCGLPNLFMQTHRNDEMLTETPPTGKWRPVIVGDRMYFKSAARTTGHSKIPKSLILYRSNDPEITDDCFNAIAYQLDVWMINNVFLFDSGRLRHLFAVAGRYNTAHTAQIATKQDVYAQFDPEKNLALEPEMLRTIVRAYNDIQTQIDRVQVKKEYDYSPVPVNFIPEFSATRKIDGIHVNRYVTDAFSTYTASHGKIIMGRIRKRDLQAIEPSYLSSHRVHNRSPYVWKQFTPTVGQINLIPTYVIFAELNTLAIPDLPLEGANDREDSYFYVPNSGLFYVKCTYPSKAIRIQYCCHTTTIASRLPDATASALAETPEPVPLAIVTALVSVLSTLTLVDMRKVLPNQLIKRFLLMALVRYIKEDPAVNAGKVVEITQFLKKFCCAFTPGALEYTLCWYIDDIVDRALVHIVLPESLKAFIRQIVSMTGVCRHRAFAYLNLWNTLFRGQQGLPQPHFLDNEVHNFIQVGNQILALGGGPGHITVVDPLLTESAALSTLDQQKTTGGQPVAHVVKAQVCKTSSYQQFQTIFNRPILTSMVHSKMVARTPFIVRVKSGDLLEQLLHELDSQQPLHTIVIHSEAEFYELTARTHGTVSGLQQLIEHFTPVLCRLVFLWDNFDAKHQLIIKSMFDTTGRKLGDLVLPDSLQILGITTRDRHHFPDPVLSRIGGDPVQWIPGKQPFTSSDTHINRVTRDTSGDLVIDLFGEAPLLRLTTVSLMASGINIAIDQSFQNALAQGKTIQFVNPPAPGQNSNAHKQLLAFVSRIKHAQGTTLAIYDNLLDVHSDCQVIVSNDNQVTLSKPDNVSITRDTTLTQTAHDLVVLDDTVSLMSVNVDEDGNLITTDRIATLPDCAHVLITASLTIHQISQLLDMLAKQKDKQFTVIVAPEVAFPPELSPYEPCQIVQCDQSTTNNNSFVHVQATDALTDLRQITCLDDGTFECKESELLQRLKNGTDVIISGDISPSLWPLLIALNTSNPTIHGNPVTLTGHLRLHEAQINGHHVCFSDPGTWKVQPRLPDFSRKVVLSLQEAKESRQPFVMQCPALSHEPFFLQQQFNDYTCDIMTFLEEKSQCTLVLPVDSLPKSLSPFLRNVDSNASSENKYIEHEGVLYPLLTTVKRIVLLDSGRTGQSDDYPDLPRVTYTPTASDLQTIITTLPISTALKDSLVNWFVPLLANHADTLSVLTIKQIVARINSSDNDDEEQRQILIDYLSRGYSRAKQAAINLLVPGRIKQSPAILQAQDWMPHTIGDNTCYTVLTPALDALIDEMSFTLTDDSVKRALVLQGQPGVGKSTLLCALAEKSGRQRISVETLLSTDISNDAASSSYIVLDDWDHDALEKARHLGVWVVFNELNLHHSRISFLQQLYDGDTDNSFRLLASQNDSWSSGTLSFDPRVAHSADLFRIPIYNKLALTAYYKMQFTQNELAPDDNFSEIDRFLASDQSNDFRVFKAYITWFIQTLKSSFHRDLSEALCESPAVQSAANCSAVREQNTDGTHDAQEVTTQAQPISNAPH